MNFEKKLFTFPKLDINNIILKPSWINKIDWTKGCIVIKNKINDKINNNNIIDRIDNIDNIDNINNINNINNEDNGNNLIDNALNNSCIKWGYYEFPYYNETVEFIKNNSIYNKSQINQYSNDEKKIDNIKDVSSLEYDYNRFNIKKKNKRILPPPILYSISKEKEIELINQQLLKNLKKNKNNDKDDNNDDNYNSDISDNLNIFTNYSDVEFDNYD
jgi:hypothetical protein